MSQRQPTVVVVGAGFGGLSAVKALAKSPVDVVLVDRNNYHGFWPLLYQVAAGELGPDDVAYGIRGLVSRRRNAKVRMGHVTEIDLEGRQLVTESGPPVSYDYLILAPGSVSADFGIPGVAEYAFPLKSLPDAIRLRHHVLERFEAAMADPELADEGALTVVVAGGGPTGIETAGAMADLFGRVMKPELAKTRMAKPRVVLADPGGRLLAAFSPRAHETANRKLTKLGVELRLDGAIASVTEEEVRFQDGSAIACQTLVWGAGIRGNPVGEALGVELKRDGRVPVEPDLSLAGHPEVFVIGDLAWLEAPDGRPYPQIAPFASQGATHAVRSIQRRLKGEATTPTPFKYRNKGIMATIGRRSAVVEIPGGIHLKGTIGWATWMGLHLMLLSGLRNRAVVLVSWVWNFVGTDRGSRVIVEQHPRETVAPPIAMHRQGDAD